MDRKYLWAGEGAKPAQSRRNPVGIEACYGEFCPDTGIGHSNDAFFRVRHYGSSGVWGTLGRIVKRGKPISRKEKRALILAGCILLVYIIMIICTTFAPWTMLRSVTGSLTNSPFQKGIYYLISFGVGLSGMAFGYASGRFRDDKDIIKGMSCLFSRFADYFVALFFIVQFFSSLMYTNLVEWVGIESYIVSYAFHICCYLPFAWMLNRKKIDC